MGRQRPPREPSRRLRYSWRFASKLSCMTVWSRCSRHLATRFTLGSLTNGNADVHKTPAGQHMSFAFLAEEVGGSKPHPALFEAALKETGAAPHEIVHVGDNPEHDIMGAIRAGFKTVWINVEGGSYPLEDSPDLTLRHVTELPDALAAL